MPMPFAVAGLSIAPSRVGFTGRLFRCIYSRTSTTTPALTDLPPSRRATLNRIGNYAVLTCNGLCDCSRRAAALTIMSGSTGTRLK